MSGRWSPQGRSMDDITIFHNPACGTSRNTLALIRHAGFAPRVVEYLKTPPSSEELRRLLAEMGMPVRQLLREKGTPYAELGLADPKWSDDQLLDFIHQHPILDEPAGGAHCPRHEALSPVR